MPFPRVRFYYFAKLDAAYVQLAQAAEVWIVLCKQQAHQRVWHIVSGCLYALEAIFHPLPCTDTWMYGLANRAAPSTKISALLIL